MNMLLPEDSRRVADEIIHTLSFVRQAMLNIERRVDDFDLREAIITGIDQAICQGDGFVEAVRAGCESGIGNVTQES